MSEGLEQTWHEAILSAYERAAATRAALDQSLSLLGDLHGRISDAREAAERWQRLVREVGRVRTEDV